MDIPASLARNAIDAWGEQGRQWLGTLPAILDEVLNDWQLQVERPFTMSLHWVCAVTRIDGAPAVLKLGPPRTGHLTTEVATLRAYSGQGAVRLLHHDREHGALLLQRAWPGNPLRELVPQDDEQATDVVVQVIQDLHAAPLPASDDPSRAPAVPELTSVRSDFKDYLRRHADPAGGPIPRRWVDQAMALFDDLVASAGEPVLLHGDLHHDNVLRDAEAPSGWLSIDPHGWIGDPGYDVGALLYNPDPQVHSDDLLRLVPRRVEQLSDRLGLPIDRVSGWVS